MTQSELARRLGVPKQQINNYVWNKQKMSLETAGSIALIIDCHIEELYEWVKAGNHE